MILSLLLAVLLRDEAAQAGAAYRAALDALDASRYEEAVQKLQEAVRAEPRETDRLLFRDREGRQRIEYYPHFVWYRVRSLQARTETAPRIRVQFLREALTHLELSQHPNARERIEAAREELAKAEKAAAEPAGPDPALAALVAGLASLQNQERFEEARELLARDAALLEKHPAERDRLTAALEERRKSTLARFDRAMTLALETAAVTPPHEKPDTIAALLESARLPAAIVREPEARAAWYRGFVDLFQKSLPALRQPDPVKLPALLEVARSFDDAARRAAAAGSVDGFRAAAHLADSIREARLALLWSADASPSMLLSDAGRALKEREEAVAALRSEDAQRCRHEIVEPLKLTIASAAARLDDRARLKADVQAWVARSEKALADPALMTEPAALRALSAEGAALESRPRWAEAEPPLASRALYLRVVLDLVAAALSEEEPSRSEVGTRIRKARDLDATVDAAWKDRLSPKLKRYLTP